MHHENALPNGHLIQEYEILSILGAGGFGITYLAKDQGLDLRVAIKEYLPQDLAVRRDRTTVVPKSSGDQDYYRWGLERFIGEARLLAKFKHPNIVRVLRYFEANGTAYMVMDYEPGQTLKQWLKNQPSQPDEAALKTLFLPVLDGLRAVHGADFLHRDIKPDNIYIRADGNPMLIDFGAARQALGEKSRSLSVVVSEGYAAKEQYSKRGKQGAWTDVYGVGASLYYGIGGKSPLDAMDRSEARDDDEGDPLIPAVERGRSHYSEGFLSAIDHALAFLPKDRPQSVRAFQRELMGEQAVPQPTPTPSPDPEPTPDPDPDDSDPSPDLRPWYKSYGAVIGLLLLAVVISLWQPWNPDVSDHEAENRQQALEDRQAALDAKEAALIQAEEKRQQEEATRRAAEKRLAAEKRAEELAQQEKQKRQPYEPEMVAIPAGSFRMGCVSGLGCKDNEKPVHTVRIQAFEIGQYEVTFDEWDACTADGGCSHQPHDNGWGRGSRPVISVSWDDAQQYLQWLSRKAGKHYRLPSEAEWEYAARAGSTTKYPWGNTIDCSKARYNGGKSSDCYYNRGEDYRGTDVVGSYQPNAFGLYDTAGNVREWTADCWNDSYQGAPTNGSAWRNGDCQRRVLRSGSGGFIPGVLRSAYRVRFNTDFRYNFSGFRVARTLTP